MRRRKLSIIVLLIALSLKSLKCIKFLTPYAFLAADSKFLKTLLSFAVGGLLGDVFLHLLPEAWEYDMKERAGTGN